MDYRDLASNVSQVPTGNVEADQYRTGWFSKLTGGQQEKISSVAQAKMDRAFQSHEAGLGREFSSAEAQKSRDYQTLMSNSAYQRATADMRKAGLNPALFYASHGGGTNVPSGATAQAGGTPGGSRPVGVPSSTGQLALLVGAIAGGITSAVKLGANVVRKQGMKSFGKRVLIGKFKPGDFR